MVLVSKLDETIVAGGRRYELGCNTYPGSVHPVGTAYLESFSRELFPVFEYRAGSIALRKTVAAVNGENTTLVVYEVPETPVPLTLELRPFVAGRDYHGLVSANGAINAGYRFEDGILHVRPYEGVPGIFLSVPGSAFEGKPEWYYDFEYGVERSRGLDFREDLFSYGVFRIPLKSGDRLGVVISTEDPARRDAFELFDRETRRRDALLLTTATQDELSRVLALAADQFLVRRGEDLRAIIAGYPWFSDWGRDSMIALPGICLVTGRFDEGKRILRAYARCVSRGMLPNHFPDSGEDPDYNTADATLWFFVAIHKYLQYTGDETFVRDELLPVLRGILAQHDRGTRYNIHVDEDGLLYAGEPGVQLTWMDAKVGDWVVTPRQGKAVEINALWCNALAIFAQLAERFGEPTEGKRFAERTRRAGKKFREIFWKEDGGYLYDVIDGDRRDASIRPNQVFALSLPFPLLTGIKAKRVLKSIEERLYTPFGLRSLAPDDPKYRPRYGGDAADRDGAYHQGTAWGWLLGPFATAVARFGGTGARRKAAKVIAGVVPHLREGGIGTISEIFDAEEPHAPRGCIAQAWSVAEVLRAHVEDAMGKGPAGKSRGSLTS
jgi:predicted glycogen debranching enzyme